MRAPPTTNIQNIGLTALKDPHAAPKQVLRNHQERVKSELLAAGMSRYGLRKSESRYLHKIIQADEHIGGVVYGICNDSSVLLAATNRRVIYLDRKPLFTDIDELTFDIVGGVNFSRAGLGATVILHTRVKDYRIRTLNMKSAAQFVNYLEQRCLLHEQPASDQINSERRRIQWH